MHAIADAMKAIQGSADKMEADTKQFADTITKDTPDADTSNAPASSFVETYAPKNPSTKNVQKI